MDDRLFSVDEISDGKVRLVSQSGKLIYIDAKHLPKAVHEGDMLRFDGEAATADNDAAAVKRNAVKEKHKRLQRACHTQRKNINNKKV